MMSNVHIIWEKSTVDPSPPPFALGIFHVDRIYFIFRFPSWVQELNDDENYSKVPSVGLWVVKLKKVVDTSIADARDDSSWFCKRHLHHPIVQDNLQLHFHPDYTTCNLN